MINSNVEKWTWSKSIEKAKQRLEEKGLYRIPQPIRNIGFLGEISDIDRITDITLANMLTHAYGWSQYTTVALAYAKAEFYSFEEMYDMYVGSEMQETAKLYDTKVVKDVLKSLAIKGSEELMRAHQNRIELQQNYILLEGMTKSMEIQVKALESETIRRASSRKIEASMR